MDYAYVAEVCLAAFPCLLQGPVESFLVFGLGAVIAVVGVALCFDSDDLSDLPFAVDELREIEASIEIKGGGR